jgi:hypothetical protein
MPKRFWFLPSFGFLFGLIALAVNLWAKHHPEWVESFYSRGLFQGIRLFWEYAFGWLPIPAFYLFWACVIAYWVWVLRRLTKVKGTKAKWIYAGLRLLGFSGVLVGCFFLLWGYNYARIPVSEQLDIKVAPLDSITLWNALERETTALKNLRERLVGIDTLQISDIAFWPESVEDTVRVAVQKWLTGNGILAESKVRCRMIRPEGLLFSFGASGIYWPWVGEGNLESGMHSLRVLPAMAHEMGHAYGFGDEGVCNFIAYVALADHPNSYLAYSARLDYWGDLARACRRQYPETFRNDFLPGIPLGILADEADIRKQHAKYQELAPELRYQVYDSYLKAQGIASGMLNYNESLMLVEAWKKANQ